MSDPIENAISAEHSRQEAAWEERMTSPVSDAMIEAGLGAWPDEDDPAFDTEEAYEREVVRRIYLAMKAKEEAADQSTADEIERIIEHAKKYDTQEGDPRRRFTLCQMETAIRLAIRNGDER